MINIGGKKIALEEAQEDFVKKNYIPLFEEYNGCLGNLLISTQEGYKGYMNLNNLKNGQNLGIFHKLNPYTVNNINLWCKLNNKSFKLLSEEYTKNSIKLKWQCLKENCGEIFESTWADIHQGRGCGFCRGFQVGLSNCLATKNPELAKEWHPTKNGELTPYKITANSNKKVWWQCLECSNEWRAIIGDRNIGKGCPQCNKSKGEKEINNYFINIGFIKITSEDYNLLDNIFKMNNKYYIPQKEYDDLIGLGGGKLSYDFYSPNCNLLVEYDGEFHYKPIRKYKNEPIKYAEERLKQQQEHDRLKNEYAKKNNIKLLRIPYWDFDRIEEILDDFTLLK